MSSSHKAKKKSLTLKQNDRSGTNLANYLKILKVCILNKNGKVLSHCFTFRTTDKRDVLQNITEPTLLSVCKTAFNGSKETQLWTMIIFYHFRSIFEMLQERYSCSWNSCRTALKLLSSDIIEATMRKTEKLLDCNDVWYLPVINSLLRNLTDVAITYYQFLSQFENDNDIIVSAFGDIMQIVRIMTADHTNRHKNSGGNGNGTMSKTLVKTPKSKTKEKHFLSHGLFFTVNQIIKLCDAINNTTYLNHALGEVEKFRSMWITFPLSDVVTHLYYKGRFSYQRNNNLMAAKKELSFAWRLCHPNSLNRYRILLLLVPIQICSGLLPNLALFPDCFVQRFEPIVFALRNANIFVYKSALDFHQTEMINAGIYLLMLKMDVLVFRQLLRKLFTWRMRTIDMDNKPHVISLQLIQTAIGVSRKQFAQSKWFQEFGGHMADDDVELRFDPDHIECILAMLIHKKLIKGYVAHGNAIVLSKNMAFPDIASVPNWYKSDF